jgi:hypothetical protein
VQQICHLDRSAAEWRDLRFLFHSHTPSKGQMILLGLCMG